MKKDKIFYPVFKFEIYNFIWGKFSMQVLLSSQIQSQNVVRVNIYVYNILIVSSSHLAPRGSLDSFIIT